MEESAGCQETLGPTESLYRCLFEQAGEAMLVTTHAGMVINANTAFLDLFGLSREQLGTLDVGDLYINPGDNESLMARVDSVGFARSFDIRAKKADGSILDCRITMTRWTNDCGLSGYLAILQDATEQRQLETQLIQAKRMEVLGRLAGGIAHDFNNILTAIGEYALLARQNVDKNSEAARDLAQLNELTDRASSLTRQLLLFSRKAAFSPKNADLNRLIGETCPFLRTLLKEQIEVLFVPAQDLRTVSADAAQIDQLLLNLGVNAKDAMPDGGRLTIETANIDIGDDYANAHYRVEPGRYVMVSVTDTGHGMDRATMEQIFEPFFTTKEPGRGTGLGLSIAYLIMKQHGGHMAACSETGQGACFRLYFPAIESTPEAAAVQCENAVPRGTEVVLVVEDEIAVRVSIERALSRLGYTVRLAADPDEAKEILSRPGEKIDLILSDVVTPGTPIQAVVDQLGPDRPKLLFMSGYPRSVVIAPTHAFLQKPFGPSVLARAVREVLDS